MAFADLGSLGAIGNTGNNQASLALTTTAAVAVGELVVVVVAVDNRVSGGGDDLAVSGVTNSGTANTWTKAIQVANNVAAQGGASVSIWYTVATAAMASGATITANFTLNSTSDATAMTARHFSLAAGNIVQIEGTPGTLLHNTALDPGALDVTTANIACLRIRACAIELGTNTNWTPTSTWTAWAGGTSTTTGTTIEMSARAEHLISTGTGASSNPTQSAAINANAYVAFKEFLAPVTGTFAPTESADVSSITGQLGVIGTLATTEPADVSNVTGAVTGGSGGGPWTPAEITAGMINWYDAADASTLTYSGLNVTQWRDKSPAVNHAVPWTTGPQLTSINGLGSLTFQLQGMHTASPVSLGDFTVFAVFYGQGLNSYERLVDHSVADGFWLGRQATSAAWGGGVRNLVDPYGYFVALADDAQVHQISTQRSGATQYVSGNGGAVVASGAVTTTATTSNYIGLGGSFNNTDLLTADIISEVLVWSRALSTDELARTEGYLAWKWGIQARLPAGHPYKSAPPTVTSGDVTGTLVVTESPDVANVTGSVAFPEVTGTLGTIEAADTTAISGTVQWVGTLAASETADALAVTATVRWLATWASVEGSDAANVTANVAWQAVLAATETADVASFASPGPTTGTMATTESADTFAATGIVFNVVTGTLVTTEAVDTAVMTGTVLSGLGGVLVATEAADVAAITGQVTGVAGILAATDLPDTAAATGQVGWQAILAATEAADTAANTGQVRWLATLAAIEAADVASFSSPGPAIGILAAIETADQAAITATARHTGTLAAIETGDQAAFTVLASGYGTLATREAADVSVITAKAYFNAILAVRELPDIAAFRASIYDTVGEIKTQFVTGTATLVPEIIACDTPDAEVVAGRVIAPGVTGVRRPFAITGTATAADPWDAKQ